MGSDDRSVLKYLSICGIFTSVALFIASFYGRTASNTLPILIGSGVIVVGLSLSLNLDPAIPFFSRMFFWTKFWNGKPSWGRPLYILLFALVLVQIPMFAIHGAPTTPVMVDGEPLTDSNGETVNVYAPAQDLQQGETFLRLVASGMFLSYYQILMYALFPLPEKESL